MVAPRYVLYGPKSALLKAIAKGTVQVVASQHVHGGECIKEDQRGA
jgi:hypothetical protein